MVNVISGPSKTEVKGMKYDFKMIHRGHGTENGAVTPTLIIKRSPVQHWVEAGQNSIRRQWLRPSDLCCLHICFALAEMVLEDLPGDL